MSDEKLMPSGWCDAQLEDLVLNPKSDLVDGPFGSNLKSSEYVESGIPVLKIQNIKANRFVRKRLSYVTPKKADELSRHSFVAGDLMITKLGEPLGLCCEVPADLEHGVFVADLMRLRPSSMIVESAFLLHAINSVVVQSQFKEITKGTTRQRVNLSIVRGIKLALPPLPEQRRIVGKVEELFSELDAGVANLKQARAQLAVYRQALLKHAFEGHLTAQWRTKHASNLESADQLLAHIRAEREERYQKQLKEWEKAMGKWEAEKKKDSKPAKPRTPPIAALPSKEELSQLPVLPAGWHWMRLGSCNVDVFDGPFGSHLKTSDYVGAGIRVVRLENIGVLKFIEEKESFITKAKYETLSEHTVVPGDIVFSSFITERTRVAMVPPSIDKAVNKADCFCVRCHGSGLMNRYATVVLSTRSAFKQLEAAVHGVGRPRINTTQLKELFIPVCSPAEQQEVMNQVDAQFSEIDALEADIDLNLQKAEALRQSILKKAFAGELVPQDPADEPAAALLARIRAEREAKAASSPKKESSRRPKRAP